MVKTKKRQLAALAANKDYTIHGLVESSKSRSAEDLHEDDDWVIVKKQRITILVPPLPYVQPTVDQSPPRTKKRRPKSKRIPRRRQPQIQSERHPWKHLHDEEFQDFDAVVTSKRDTRKADAGLTFKGDTRINGEILSSPPSTMKKLTESASGRRTVLKGPSRLIRDESMYRPTTSITQVRDNERVWQGASGSSQAVRVAGVLKDVNKNKGLLTTFPPPGICRDKGPTQLFVRSISCLNMGLGVLQQNQKMRASNLERKLEKAGGLSRWLMSLGLGQYVQMFRGRNVSDKFQLLNLTMGKLKDMGVIAVGPRRKLMHAIDCLSFQECTLSRGLLEKGVPQRNG